MSRETGSERIQELINAGELGQVPPDTGLARRMLADAGRHLATAGAADSTGDLPGAYQLAYDALRKSAAGLLEAQGLRATSRGAHRRTGRCHRPVRIQHPGASLVQQAPTRATASRIPARSPPPFGRRREGRDPSRPRGKRRGRQGTGKRNPLPLVGDSSAGPGISAQSRRTARFNGDSHCD